jgi:hypothetical protein
MEENLNLFETVGQPHFLKVEDDLKKITYPKSIKIKTKIKTMVEAVLRVT